MIRKQQAFRKLEESLNEEAVYVSCRSGRCKRAEPRHDTKNCRGSAGLDANAPGYRVQGCCGPGDVRQFELHTERRCQPKSIEARQRHHCAKQNQLDHEKATLNCRRQRGDVRNPHQRPTVDDASECDEHYRCGPERRKPREGVVGN